MIRQLWFQICPSKGQISCMFYSMNIMIQCIVVMLGKALEEDANKLMVALDARVHHELYKLL